MIEEKQRKKKEEEREKMERKRAREERKKAKEQEAEAKRMRMQEKKKQKENEKKERHEKTKRKEKQSKKLLSASQKQKGQETESSDSGDEPVLDDDSDELVEFVNELCPKCESETRAKVRVQCALCDSWWHVECVNEIDWNGKSQEDIEVGIEFYCMNCN